MFSYIVKLAVAAGLIGFLVHNGQLDFRQMLKLSSLNILTCMVLTDSVVFCQCSLAGSP